MSTANQRTEAWFRALMEQSPLSTQVFSPDGRTIQVNRAWERLWGATVEQVAGYNILEDQQLVAKGLMPYIRRGFAGEALAIPAIWYDPNETLPNRSTRADPRRWVRAFIHPVKTERGEICEVILIHEDMTDQKLAEDALRRSEQRFSRFMQHLPGLAWAKDAEGRYVFANDAAVSAFKTTREELYDRTDDEVFSPQTAAQFKQNDQRALASLNGVQIVETLVHPDGVEHHSLVSKFPIAGANGDATLIGGIAIDITELNQAQSALTTSEQRLRLALAAGRMGVWELNLQTNDVWWSDNLEEIHGLPAGSFGGTLEAFQRLIHPDDRERVRISIARTIEQGTDYNIEFRNVWPDGTIHWTAGKGRVFPADGGKPSRMIGVAVDVTERVKSQQERDRLIEQLQESQEQFRSIVSDSVAGVAEVDLDGRFLFVNQRYAEIVGRSSAELRGLRMQDICHPDELPENLRLFEQLSQFGMPYVIEKRYVRPDGSEVWVHNSISPLRGAGGLIKSVVAVCVDVSDRRRAEDALRDADRRKNEFLATLAHELRNPLAPIQNSLQLLQMAGDDRSVQEQAQSVMQRQVQQMVRLVDDLLDVSRITRNRLELRKANIELTTVVDHALEAFRPLIESLGQKLIVELPAQTVYLHADLSRLAQVIANLLNNAAKYSDHGSSIVLTANTTGCEVVLSVKDTGIGIDPADLPKLFQMFSQATSAIDRSQGGLGIGLALVKGLVEMHGGTVEARSDGPGKGSEFVVRLPILQKPILEQGAAPANHGTNGKNQYRVLVVDDNQDSAGTLSLTLRFAGHHTQTAYDGPQAVELAEAWRPDVIVLDIGLPTLNGYQVAEQIRAEPWGKEILLVALTGWGQDEDKKRAKDAGFDHHLTKPVDFTILHRLLDAKKPQTA